MKIYDLSLIMVPCPICVDFVGIIFCSSLIIRGPSVQELIPLLKGQEQDIKRCLIIGLTA